MAIYTPAEDLDIMSVTEIFTYYKKHDYQTGIICASFRNIE